MKHFETYKKSTCLFAGPGMQGIKVPQICEMTRTDQKGFKREFFSSPNHITSSKKILFNHLYMVTVIQGQRLLDLAFCLHIVHSYSILYLDNFHWIWWYFTHDPNFPWRNYDSSTVASFKLFHQSPCLKSLLFVFIFLWIPRSESHLQRNPLTKRPRLIIVAVFQSAFKGDAKANKSRSLWHCESPWIHRQEYCFKYDIIWFSSSKVMNNHIIPIESNTFPWKRWRRCCCPLSLCFVTDVKER